MANGFSYHNAKDWANLGQGAPEVGPIPNAPPRVDAIPVPVGALEYAPTTGVKGCIFLRIASLSYSLQRCESLLQTCTITCTARARLANTLMKTCASSLAVVLGSPGWLLLSGMYTVYYPFFLQLSSLTDFLCKSYQVPDYTAYDQVLSAFKRLVPVPTAYVLVSFIISLLIFY